MFFSNVTSWGPLAQSFVYEEELKAKYKVIGFVETHVESSRDPYLHTRASAQGFDSFSNPAMKYSSTSGTHGGEVILSPKYIYCVPIQQIILETANNANDETPRYACVEARFGEMSFLDIIAYF